MLGKDSWSEWSEGGNSAILGYKEDDNAETVDSVRDVCDAFLVGGICWERDASYTSFGGHLGGAVKCVGNVV